MNRGYSRGLACALLLGLTNLAIAKIPATSLPGTLSIDGWQFKAEDGQLGLAKADSREWTVNAPTMTDPKGLFVSTDPDGEEPTVHLVKEQSADTKWAFEFLEDFGPKTSGTEKESGPQGYRFKMKVAEGPFKGWYIAVDPLPAAVLANPDKAPKWRPLKLVQDPKQASTIQYITAFHRRKK